MYVLRYIAAMSLLWAGSLYSNVYAGPGANRYASIAVDADSREVLHARQIDAPRYPASLTKMMTLYLVFDAIDRGDLALSDKMTVSRNAAAAQPVKLGLRAGQTLTVHKAIQALAVKSSNDVAIVIAEHIGGTEDNFAMMMTARAKSLGMNHTTYMTASGLPHPAQLTTARDQAKLADQILVNHRKYYHYFGQQSFVYKGRTLRNHNRLLGRVDGVDGFKTGYTNASGYNLTISAQRDGRRIIAVVLGGASTTARNQHMERLIDRAFEVQAQKPALIAMTQPQTQLAAYTGAPRVFNLRGRGAVTRQVVLGVNTAPMRAAQSTWQIQIGLFSDPVTAEAAIDPAMTIIGGPATPDITPMGAQYRVRLTGLEGGAAQAACAALRSSAMNCMLIAPAQ